MKALSDAPAMTGTDSVVAFPARSGEKAIERNPIVDHQRGPRVTVIHGEQLGMGTWVRLGDHAGIVCAHERSKAIVQVMYETDGESWFDVEHGICRGAEVKPLTGPEWESLLRSQYPESFQVGFVSQGDALTPGLVPALDNQVRILVTGQAGSGKSGAMNTCLINYRNQLIDAGRNSRPALIVFDMHGDFLGRVRDRKGKSRPSLFTCGLEEPIVLGINSLVCRVSDLPADLFPKTIELSKAQKRWVDLYCSNEGDHENLQHLLFKKYQPNWHELFKELASSEEKIPKPMEDSLVLLRSKLLAVIGIGDEASDSLFKKDGESTWHGFMGHIRQGRTIIIDVSEFRPVQQSLLLVLVLENLIKEQKATQRKGGTIQSIVIAADEIHNLENAEKSLIKASLEGRKFGINLFLGSQSLNHFAPEIVNMATHGIVMRTQGSDLDTVVKRWPELKFVQGKLRNLPPGDGFLVGGGSVFPLRFADPAVVRPPRPPKNLSR